MIMSGSKHFSEIDFDGITFSDEDLKGVELPHNDALVVSMMVANAKVDKIFVTSGFGPRLLYLSTLKKVLGLSIVSISMLLLRIALKKLDELIGSQHNAGVGEVRGDQKKARECEKALQELAERKASQGTAGTK
ncbi:unnamed protein product [Prunus armeniaca]